MAEKKIEDYASRLLASVHQGYVHNRRKEMDRLDHSTGWSIGILTFFLSFALGTNIEYYVIPLVLVFMLLFWVKESRRYVYYIFWSYKESKIEGAIRHLVRGEKLNTKAIDKIMAMDRPLELISMRTAMKTRFYRSYYWIFVITAVTSTFLAFRQGAFANPMVQYIFAGAYIILALMFRKGEEEFTLPRTTIMRMGIGHDKKA